MVRGNMGNNQANKEAKEERQAKETGRGFK